MKFILKALLAAVLLVSLCGCGQISAPTQVSTEPPVEQIAMVVTPEELAALDAQYPALKAADFSGSTCYAAIAQYAADHPNVSVTYRVSLGTVEAATDSRSLELNPEDFDFLDLRDNLQYLPQLETLTLHNTQLMPDAIQVLREAYPGIDIHYDVELCGVRVDGETIELDASGMDPAALLEQGYRLELLPNLETIQLMDAQEQSAYTLEDAAALQKYVPDAMLQYSFKLFDKTVSTTQEEVSYVNQYIGNKAGAADTLRMALSVMRGCKRFVLDNCHFDNDVLADIRREFRGTTKVVWRIWFGEGGCLTDREVIRHVYGLYDYNSVNLKYCEDAQFLDFGHNEYLKNCDFVAGMPNLKAVILSGSMISDLTPFASCPNLEFLEIAYCGYITDISPLANCPKLQRLNIAYTKVADLTALDALNLEVLVDARSKVPVEEQQRFNQQHPECITQHTGDAKDDQPYGYPWRYEQNGDANPYYDLLKEKFHYPKPSNTNY